MFTGQSCRQKQVWRTDVDYLLGASKRNIFQMGITLRFITPRAYKVALTTDLLLTFGLVQRYVW